MIMSKRTDPKQALHPKTSSAPANGARLCPVTPQESLRAGVSCPRCGLATIDYDGLLNLVCPNCGLTEAGACT